MTTKRNLILFFLAVLLFFFPKYGFSQNGCENCNITNPSPADQNTPLTINDGDVVCFTESRTFGGLQFYGGTVCIAEEATLTISNNLNADSGTTINMEIYGTLQLDQTPNISADVNINIYSNGVLRAGSTGSNNFDLNGPGTNSINNYGLIDVGVLAFNNTQGEYFFDNHGTMNITSNMNIQAQITSFINDNTGVINLGGTFNMNSGTSYLNCGTITANGGFNMGGGSILNTGSFTVNGNINYGSATSRVENYGTFEVSGGSVQLHTGAVFYNEGVVSLLKNEWGYGGTFDNDGNIEGPAVNSGKMGYLYLDNQANINNGNIGPNLNFKYTGDASDGGSSFAYLFRDRAGLELISPVYWDCESTNSCVAPKQTYLNLCPDASGQMPPDAVDDIYTDVVPGTTLSISVTDNDKNFDGTPVVIGTESGQIAISTVTDSTGIPGNWPEGFTLDSAGTINVAPTVAPGTHTLYYQICLQPGGTACDVAEVTIEVISTTALWVGTESTDPTVANNWSNNTVPTPGSHVEFATATNNNNTPAVRDLVTVEDMIIGDFTNASDKNFIISPETSVEITGKVTITDPATNQPSTDPNKIQIKAEAGKPNGSLIINCEENSTAGEPNPIYATVELYAKGEKGHPFSWLDTIPGSPTYNNVTYAGEYRFQHFGVPVKTVKADPTFAGAFLFEYSEPTNAENSYFFKWIALNNESDLTKFKGYEITQDAPKIYRIQGELVFCEQNITLTHSAATVNGSNDDNEYNKRYGLGQNIFGNSFTSSIPIGNIVFPEGVEEVVYLYNTGTFGEWATIDRAATNDQTQVAGNYIAIPKGTASTMEYGNIPSMQGFLLRHLAPGGNQNPITMSLPYLSLTKNTKPQLTPKSGKNKRKDNLSYLRIELNSKSTIDNLWLFSQPGTTERYDNGWDGRKYFGTPTAFIYSESPDGALQVNSRETIDGSIINFYPNDDKEYQFTIVKSNLGKYSDLHLLDIVTKSIIPLQNDTTVYKFSSVVPTGKVNKRFVIVNKEKSRISFDNGEFETMNAFVSSDDNSVTINNYTGFNGRYMIFDISGSLVMNGDMLTGTNNFAANLKPGAYILQLSASNQVKSIKFIIK
ncbi:MAG: T9SS type A sorting domain-containing protein [Porphyromonadaceae bacterium]|nr:T9SS type A sorting domain-containing protein [Porphyromonadaceae bacterium]